MSALAKLTIVVDGVEHPVPAGRGYERLSAKQREVLGLVARGQTNKAIAHQIGVTEGTVKTHIMHAAKKHGGRCLNRITLAMWFIACCPTEELDEILEAALPPRPHPHPKKVRH